MPKLLIGALSGWKYRTRRQQCLTSWMADGDRVGIRSVFLMGCGTAEFPEQVGPHTLVLPCPDDYPSLTQRTRWFCRWALSQDGWDYLLKLDDDTYVSIPRIAAYDYKDRPYIGAEWKRGVHYGSGGAGYLLSRAAAAIVAEKLTDPTGNEDLVVGRILKDAGVPFSIDKRFVPFGNPNRRPRADNDKITAHRVDPMTFLLAHEETGLKP